MANNFNKICLIKNNLLYNIQKFKNINKKTKICAVVKANAYGHGINGVVNCIKKQVDFFAVTNFSEAISVRNITNKPILILSNCEKQNISECIKNNISLSVSSLSFLNLIINKAKKLNLKAKIHLKINTGMNRLGFSNIVNFKKSLEKFNEKNNIILEGVYTHFFDATNIKNINTQNAKFKHFLNLIDNCQHVIIHAAATNTAIYKHLHYNMIRIGLGLYGYIDANSNYNLKPVLKLESKIIHKQRVKKGECVGYGSNFIANKNMTIAVINLGYADGFLRSNGNGGHVLIMNKYAKIVGNICMDLFMCDVSDIKCKVGDNVIIIGENENLKIDANDLAKINNTIAYEVLTNFKTERFEYTII